jgi:mono/diheme cytochrome c family protein
LNENFFVDLPLTRDLLNNQFTNTDSWIQGVALAVLATLFVALLALLGIYQFRDSDPYIQNVLSLKGDAVQGQAIFQMNCSSCHGLYADGMVGPSLHNISDRKSRVGLIKQVTSGNTPPMPQFQPSSQEMADLLEYLESL